MYIFLFFTKLQEVWEVGLITVTILGEVLSSVSGGLETVIHPPFPAFLFVELEIDPQGCLHASLEALYHRAICSFCLMVSLGTYLVMSHLSRLFL